MSKVRDETNLASSSLVDTGNVNDLLGVIVSYSIKVKLMLGGMGGELETDLPFKLVHPHPDSEESIRLDSEKKSARAKVWRCAHFCCLTNLKNNVILPNS